MRGRLLRAWREGVKAAGGAAAPPWRVLFFGTDRFAVTALRALQAARYRSGRAGGRGLRAGDGAGRLGTEGWEIGDPGVVEGLSGYELGSA